MVAINIDSKGLIFLFVANTKVRTTQEYFNRTGRTVKGTTIKLYCDVPKDMVGVIWEEQTGNVDFLMQGLKVLMHDCDLEEDI